MKPRTEEILKAIVRRYIRTAEPTASVVITQECGLGISPATVRNEMTLLEEGGYITRPHYASGSIPTDRSYRYYVNTCEQTELSEEEKRVTAHLFYQVERDLEEWLGLAVSLLARMSHGFAFVTLPLARENRFQHAEIISLKEYLALLVLVLRGAKAIRELITLEEAIPQDELDRIANRLNSLYRGLTVEEILSIESELTAEERKVSESILRLMKNEDDKRYEASYYDGWFYLLSQPEFKDSHQLIDFIRLAEQRQLLGMILPPEDEARVNVLIGQENKAEAIKNFSVVIGRYGLPTEATGYLGIIGPTRMPYERTIAVADYLGTLMDWLMTEVH